MTDERDLLTVVEAAQALELSPRGVLARLERGAMKGHRVNQRLWLIPRAEIERWQQLGRLKPGRKPKGQQSVEEREKESE